MPTPEFVLKALHYGVIGLCAVMLCAAWWILIREQRRPGQPRKGILTFAAVFMVFCLCLALLAGFLESKKTATANAIDRATIQTELESMRHTLCTKGKIEAQQSKNADIEAIISELTVETEEAYERAGGDPKKLLPCH